MHMTTEVQVAGGVVLNARGEVAIVKNRDEFWSLPKGHIEEGEDAITAARREIEEETGLTNLSLERELGSYERYRGTVGGGDDLSEHRTIRMFLFTTDAMTLAPQDSYNPEARWVSPEHASEMLTHPKDKEFFMSIKDSLK
jgi:8-oxo-dGTP pyrophosphatase MutT (NUDIX family)